MNEICSKNEIEQLKPFWLEPKKVYENKMKEFKSLLK